MPLLTYVGNVSCGYGGCERKFVIAGPNQPTILDAKKTMIGAAVMLCAQQCDPDVRGTLQAQPSQFTTSEVRVTTQPLINMCRKDCHNQAAPPANAIYVHANGDTKLYKCLAAEIAISTVHQCLKPNHFSPELQMTVANTQELLKKTFDTARLGQCAKPVELFDIVDRLQRIVK